MFTLPIAQPPWRKLGKRLESATRKALYTHELFEGVERVAIALSGGKDSLALLFLLRAIVGRGFPAIDIHAIHVTGSYSCGASLQEKWLRSICQAIDVPLVVLQQEGPAPVECYSCSRVRRSLIFKAAKERGISTIAFGHHRDDNAQTLMLNLFQKGEFAGMLPKIHMQRYEITLIRPLLYISEAEIRAFAKEYGFLRLTCQCPIGADSMRKKVDGFITQLETYFPHVRTNLSHASLTYGSDKANYIKGDYEKTTPDSDL